MRKRSALAMLGLAGLAGSPVAAATGAWSWTVTTADGDSVVEPGEVAEIRIWIDLAPSTGEYDMDLGGTIKYFAGALLDVVAQPGWSAGRIAQKYVNPELIFLTGDVSYIDEPTQSVLNVLVTQICGFGPCFTEDPIWALDLTWDPAGDFSPRAVGAVLDGRGSELGTKLKWGDDEGNVAYWEPGSSFDKFGVMELPDGMISIEVVPAPMSVGLLVASGAVGGIRRRKR